MGYMSEDNGNSYNLCHCKPSVCSIASDLLT